VNLTESIPSIHTGPAEFKRMISPPTQGHATAEFTEEMFEQKVEQNIELKLACCYLLYVDHNVDQNFDSCKKFRFLKKKSLF